MKKCWTACLAIGAISGAVFAAPPGPIDGKNIPTDFADATTLGVQTNRTGFGDQDVEVRRLRSEGSELNAIFMATNGTHDMLHIGLTGNLRDIGNAFAIFIDSADFGHTGDLKVEGLDGAPWTLQQSGRIVMVNTNGTPGDTSDDTSEVVPNSGMKLPDCGLGGGFTGWDFVAVVDAFEGNTNLSEYVLFDFAVGPINTSGTCIYDINVGQVNCDLTPDNDADTLQVFANRTGVGGGPINGGALGLGSGYTLGFNNTNTSGVTTSDVSMVAMSTTGAEIAIPLTRIAGFSVDSEFRVMVLILDGDEFGFTQETQGYGSIVNQVLPPVINAGTCGAKDSFGVRPDLSGLSCLFADASTLGLFTGTSDGLIDPSEYGLTSAQSSQFCPTDYGDQAVSTTGLFPIGTPFGGNELNMLYGANDDTFLYLGITGNIEPRDNGQFRNSLNIFIDADSNGDQGEHVVDFEGAPGIGGDIGGMQGIELANSSSNGLPGPDDLAVQYNFAYGLNPSTREVFIDYYDLVNNAFTFRGEVDYGGSEIPGPVQSIVPGPSINDPANNPNGLLAGINMLNSAGVIECNTGEACFLETPDEVAARARTADTGWELAIPLADIGLTSADLPRRIRVWMEIGGPGGGTHSDQSLPSMRNQSALGNQVVNFAQNTNFTDPFNANVLTAYEARAADYCLQTVDGDADCDGDNDLADVQLIQLCVEDDMPSVTLPRLPLPLECERLDRNGDNHVTDADLGDLTALIDASGPQ